jgi:hypothetical protein
MPAIRYGLPDVVSGAHAQARTDGLSKKAIGPLAERLIANARERLASLTASRPSGAVRRKRRPL